MALSDLVNFLLGEVAGCASVIVCDGTETGAESQARQTLRAHLCGRVWFLRWEAGARRFVPTNRIQLDKFKKLV